MSERIGIWVLASSGNGVETAVPLEELEGTDTEQRLENLLVASPDLLLPGLTLIGRQVMTGGGPLDLIGVDDDGRPVLFELKRGTLTRDAVAQIIDYASDLATRSADDFALLVQQNSGRNGIEPIDDFADWYAREFADATDRPPTGLRLILVGLGVDERAKRMVNYLAQTGLDIQLLTFQAFRSGESLFLARKVETVEPTVRAESASGGQKERNRRELYALAREQGVESLLTTVADFIATHVPSYRWPGKTTFSYYLAEQTEAGTATQRNYVTLTVDAKLPARLIITFPERAVAAAGDAINRVEQRISGARRTTSVMAAFHVPVTPGSWPAVEQPLGELLDAMLEGWKRKVRIQNANELAEETAAPAGG